MQCRFPASCLFFLLSLPATAQNLIVNGGLEEENICTEYSVNCAPEGWISSNDGFTNYFKNARRAHGGLHCMAIEAGYSFKPFYRTYIRTRLICGLRKDHHYRVEFYIKSPHPILDSMGVLFTSFDFLYGQKRLQNLAPSLFIRPVKGSFLKDSSWQKVSMDYQATGEESFMAIANFSRRDINRETGISMEKHFFVFIDDISLTPVDPHEQLCAGWQKNREDIYSQNERHEYLRVLIRRYKDAPPTVVIPTTLFTMIDTVIVPDVLFATGRAGLQESSNKVLDDLCKDLAGKNIDSIVVEGHTDNTGTARLNKELALDRALTIEKAIRRRLTGNRLVIITRAWGDRRPLADNGTAAGRQQNRRVEMIVYTRE